MTETNPDVSHVRTSEMHQEGKQHQIRMQRVLALIRHQKRISTSIHISAGF